MEKTNIKFSMRSCVPMYDYPKDFGKDPKDFHVEWMSPNEYLAKVGHQQYPGMLRRNCQDPHSPYCRELMNMDVSDKGMVRWQEELLEHRGHQQELEKLARNIKRNGLKCIPRLEFKYGNQEGRHRMLALKTLGVERVPVMIAED